MNAQAWLENQLRAQAFRRILHADMDTFFVSVERRRNPALVGQPVLVGGTGPRSVVSACSYETRRYGVHSGMPMAQARRLCPQAVVVSDGFGRYSEASQEVLAIVRPMVPLLQVASVDEWYADLTGLDRYHGSWALAQELRRRVLQQTGLPMSMALATSRIVAKVATNQVKPNNEIYLTPGTEAAYLAPLAIEAMPGVGAKAAPRLHALGLRTLGVVQQAGPQRLQAALGRHGLSLWRRAYGVDRSPVTEGVERKQISVERTFERDVADPHQLRRLLVRMAENVGYRLRQKGRLATGLTLKLRYPPFETHTRQTKLRPTCDDAAIIRAGLEVFDAFYTPGRPLRLLGLGVHGLQLGAWASDLFDPNPKGARLASTLDQLRQRYGGQQVVGRAKGGRLRGGGRFRDGEQEVDPEAEG